jgi:pimeloyl-ACP methyl ester carboxylesterase
MSVTSQPTSLDGVYSHPSYESAIDDHPGDGSRDAPTFAVDAGRRAGASSGVRFRRVGSGPPLLLVHPIGGDRHFWDVILPRMCQLRDVIVPDLPGHGESAALPSGDPPTPKRLAASLAALLDELGIERAHLGGCSLGAWVGLELAAMGRALSVAAMCPSGLTHDVPRLGRPPRAVVPPMPIMLRSMRFRRRVLGTVVAHPERAPLRDLVHYSRSVATAPGFASTLREMERSQFSDWDAIDVPVTLAWGEDDAQVRPIAPPRQWIRWDVLAGCGHAAPVWDNPDEVGRVLLRVSNAYSACYEEELMTRDWIAAYRVSDDHCCHDSATAAE